MAPPSVSRFQQMIRRLFSIKSDYDADVISDFMPTIDLSHWYEVDRLRLGEVHVVGGGLSFTSAALNFPQFTLAAAPNTLVVVKRLELGNDAGTGHAWVATWAFGAFNAGLGPTQAVHTDTRAQNPKGGPLAPPSCFFSSGNQAIAPVGPFIFRFPSSFLNWFDCDLVIYGGTADPKVAASTVNSWQLLLTVQTLAFQANCSFSGFVRHVEPSEQY